MIAKFFFALCAVGCAFGYQELQIATKRCASQDECAENECCSQRFLEYESYCVPKRKLYEICLSDDLENDLINGVYSITCPCEGNLKCTKQEITTPNGEIRSIGLPRCLDPNFRGSRLENFLRFQYRQNQGDASANAGDSSV